MEQDVKTLRAAYIKYNGFKFELEMAENDLKYAKSRENQSDDLVQVLETKIEMLKEKFVRFKEVVLRILSQKPELGSKVEKLVSIKAVEGEISVSF